MAKKKKGNNYTVQAGDSWAKIAGKLYGNQRMFKELMAANPQLKYLRPGQSINLAMPKRNEDIVISNAAAQAMGMATSNEVADFYGQNANAQKYGMTNMLRDAAAGASWNTSSQTTPAGNAQYQGTQASANEQARMAGGMQDAQIQADMRANLATMRSGFNQGTLSATNEQRRMSSGVQSQRRPFSAPDDRKVPRMPARPDRPVANVDRPEQGGFFDILGKKVDRFTGGFQLPSLPNFGGMPSSAQGGPFQVGMGPLGPSVGLSPQGMAGAAQAVGAASVAMGGQPPAGATVNGAAQPAQPQQGPTAPVDPVKQAVTNIESGKATDKDYVTIAKVHLESGQMTAQDWQYAAKVLSPDELKTAYAEYSATFGFGGSAPPGMDITAGGIGNPSGVSSMVGNVFVGPNFDANKLRGYTNANGTFVAANLAGSYFAPLKPSEMAGYRAQRRATQLQESGGYPGSGLSTGLYTWRL